MNMFSKIFSNSVRPPLNITNPIFAKLATELQELDRLPLSTPTEIEAWDAASDVFRKKLYTEYSEAYDSLPHEIEHYLTDSDIRARDPDYADYQRGLLSEILKHRNEN
jgi:hypothetical protein